MDVVKGFIPPSFVADSSGELSGAMKIDWFLSWPNAKIVGAQGMN
jgi:hypothetical protein